MSTPNPHPDSPPRKVLSITSIMNDDSNNTKKEEESAPSVSANTNADTNTNTNITTNTNTNPVITPSKKINIMDINSMTNNDQDPIPSSPIGESNIDNVSPSRNPHRVSTWKAKQF
ncbi:unnamed protein product [[Candida] boidinii]|uniref:Unnamed protein product n=1 Tax=Candida boidinii TaxID=5477 RepID=A0A9W6T2U1_CANBO|nr:hypothetical protein B5S33_g4709 [[Candida] boidinii]GME70347.1 unnamed protein product [[Candida] boidinii]GMF30072.1 unnamed protein product [[Candida] boidinii]GMF52468.1 unnamed protein product [[Candida] boidinii]